ncbi:MAG: ferritin family protein [Gammaproteobacteria bacterium]|jgi:rubrerythrin|nr:ferritin family protein [Gammaproteobacteria bacterium]
MNTVDEILDYAIDQEQQAADFYEDVAQRAETAGMKKILLDFSEEEKSHKRILQEVKAGEHELTPEQEVLDLKISDYLVEVEISDNITYQDALIIAMKRERAAYELYSDMAAKVPESHLKEVLEGLAIEEAKHKLFFEAEYDERVLMDN